MALITIKNKKLWKDGTDVDATKLEILLVRDDLVNSAEFYYSLSNEDQSEIIRTGNVVLSGNDYNEFTNSNKSRLEAASNAVLKKLSLTKK